MTLTDPARLAGRTHRRARLAPELIVGLSILGAIALASLVVTVFPTYSVGGISDAPFAPPGGDHLLGTDNLGRDTFTRLFVAAGTSLMIAAAATGISMVLGTTLGMVAAYRGGIADAIIMRACDVVMTIPAILMALLVRVIIGPGVVPLIIAMAIIYTPTFTKIMRAPVLAMRNRDFVVAAQLSGIPGPLIALRHLLPNATTPLMVQAAVTASEAVLLEAGLSYLGQGVQPPNPSVGMMISEFQKYAQEAPLLILLPGLVIILMAAGWNLVADGLQATFAPRGDGSYAFLAPISLASRFASLVVPARRTYKEIR
ncbi:ABC transporter permease [Microbacterium sp. NPDC079995]|uniref:ABC transporter permease n=1 Tax=unclassified Microbacterium TaxID=2609290 RepID=UPI00344EBFE9